MNWALDANVDIAHAKVTRQTDCETKHYTYASHLDYPSDRIATPNSLIDSSDPLSSDYERDTTTVINTSVLMTYSIPTNIQA